MKKARLHLRGVCKLAYFDLTLASALTDLAEFGRAIANLIHR